MGLKPLSNMPKMGNAFSGWMIRIDLIDREQWATDGDIEEISKSVIFKGVIQPLSPKEISQKPEGQRAYTWLQIHAVSGSLNLNVNDRIIYSKKAFKIMKLLDYSLNGYIEYHAIEDFIRDCVNEY